MSDETRIVERGQQGGIRWVIEGSPAGELTYSVMRDGVEIGSGTVTQGGIRQCHRLIYSLIEQEYQRDSETPTSRRTLIGWKRNV